MLVLSRRANQSIVIGDNVTITVIEIRNDQVRLGITAPREIRVHREEVAAEIRAANQRAASTGTKVTKDLPLPPTFPRPKQ
ncbi:MAG: carbon storage regulator CsrA [Actinomycetia bacterium]|nr:carbon storage regulator CsrA [Actinomycetes bacterium]